MADRGIFTNLTFRVDRFEAGVPTGFMDAFNVTEMQVVQPEPEIVNRTSFMVESYGQSLGTIALPKPTEIEFKTDSLPVPYLSMALMGTPATYAQTAANDTVSSVKVIADKWVPLERCELSAISVLETAIDTTPYVLGVDYEVNLPAGLLKALSTGAIADGAVVFYKHTAPARSGYKIAAGTQSLIQLKMRGDGINADTGKRCGVVIHKANISPSGNFAFIGKEYLSMSFKGTLIKPESEVSAWAYWEYD